MSTASPTRTRPAHPGPPLVVPAVGFVLLFVAPIFLGGLFGAVGTIPNPYGSPETVHTFFAANQTYSQISGFLMLLSAMFLVLFSAIALSRLNYLAPNAPGPLIAAVGGLVAGLLQAVSALVQWVLGQPAALVDPRLTQTLHCLSFVAGGPGHMVGLGMLLFGLSITLWFLGRVPRWLCVVGYVIAAISVLASLAMLLVPASPLIPLGRFTGMIWLIAVSALIPRERAARHPG